jgi:predicted PurR-regulated permease PerM
VGRIVTLIILTVLVIALGFLFIQVMIGFLVPLFLAVLLTVLFRPLHKAITLRLGGYHRTAAAITTLLILVIVLAPLVFVIVHATEDAARYLFPPEGPRINREALNHLVDGINKRFDLQPGINSDKVLTDVSANARDWLSPVALKTPGFIGGLLINAFITVLALYYFLADGEDMVSAGTRLVPLESKYQAQLLARFVEMSRAVATATLVTAIVQGILAAIGYYFAGLDGVLLLMILTIFASFVPIVGSSIVWVPCSLWLIVEGRTAAGIALAAWCLTMAVAVDNLLKPMILQGQANLHPLLGLLSVLGGVAAMGPLGIFIGPMAVAFLQTGLRMLNEELENLRKAPVKDEGRGARGEGRGI